MEDSNALLLGRVFVEKSGYSSKNSILSLIRIKRNNDNNRMYYNRIRLGILQFTVNYNR